jgi:hypothetical protein
MVLVEARLEPRRRTRDGDTARDAEVAQQRERAVDRLLGDPGQGRRHDRVELLWNRFWRWYERHYALNVALASGLFVLQLVHLYWLAADPIATRLTGESLFDPAGAVQYAILFVDYTPRSRR